MKNYCIFIRKKDDPTDIMGMVERSFSMDWSKDRVCVWYGDKSCYDKPNVYHKKMRTKLKKSGPQYGRYGRAYCQFGWGSPVIWAKGQMKNVKRALTDYKSRDFHPCGRSYNEYMWHWVNHYAQRVKKPEGYDEVIVCRVNSKHCPVKVDMSERTAMDKKEIEFNKYNWRNPKFTF